MRHLKNFNHLGRKTGHRKAMLSNMATSLILHKKINTTVAKAKALRKFVEPIITRSKTDSQHSRRMVFRSLQDKEAVKILFGEISEKVGTRAGGYTRILKTGNRLGDNAEMCLIELVDYNENMLTDSKPAKKKSRRRSSGKKKTEATAAPVAEETSAVEDATVVEDTAATEAVATEEVVETAAAEETPAEEVKAEAAEEESTEEKSEESGEENSEEEKKDE